MEIYFDNAATTVTCKEAADMAYMIMREKYGNPSSLHNKGLEIEKEISLVREKIAKAWGADKSEIYFTSGGTESNNLALCGAILKGSKWGNRVITTKMEHPAVSEVLKHYEKKGVIDLQYINVMPNGQPDLEHLKEIVNDKVILLSMMCVNNETGCVLPVKAAGDIVKKASPRAFIHSDMVQAFGKINCRVTELGVDFASCSSHKIHGPKGVGALYIKKGVTIPTTVFGGGQEKGFRSGTENAPSICGFGIAAEISVKTCKENEENISKIKKILANGVINNIENCKINGENTVSNILNITFEGLKSEILLHSLESEGIYVSSGSACSSNHPSPSSVLTAMGLSHKEIDGSVRFSFSRYNTTDEAEKCLQVLINEVPKIRRFYDRGI
ncbi:MAG: cysteine desulfurase [Clostridia bacterium]|nr:cysteine desulfurase [Clostridia bacterium]